MEASSSSKRAKPLVPTELPPTAMMEPILVSIGERSQETEQESRLSQEYHPSRLHSLYRKYLQAMLLVLGWDLFAVYKSYHQQTGNRSAKYRTLFPPELRISRDSFDKWRRRVRIPVYILTCCLVTYLMTVGLIQIANGILLDMYILNSARNLNSSSRDQLSAFLSSNFARSIMPTYHQTTIKQVIKLGNSVKKPYDSIGETDLAEVLVAMPVFYIYILVPLALEANPLNAPIERFLLDPARELCRIDLATKRYLDLLLKESSKSTLTRDRSDLVASLRPHTFDAKWFHSLYSLASALALFALTVSIFGSAAFFYIVYLLIERPLCIIHEVKNCGFWSIFTVSDSIHLATLAIGTCGMTVVYSLPAIVLVGTNIRSQLALVRAANDDLNRCLSMFRVANTLALDRYSLDSSSNQSHGELCIDFNRRLVSSTSLLKNTRTEQEVELGLLRTYVRLAVSLDEIEQIASLVARILESILTIVGHQIFINLINSVYNDARIPYAKIIMFINCYFITYPLMLVCSFAFARTVELEKVAWSILAELAVYQELAQRTGNLRSCKSREHIEMLAGRWRKLVRSYALSSRRHASRPFGLSITYKQTMSIDYFVVSIALVLLQR